MYPLRYYLHKRIIDNMFNDALNEINKSGVSELDGIYNYYFQEFKAVESHIKHCDGGNKRQELLNLIENDRKEIKQMILKLKKVIIMIKLVVNGGKTNQLFSGKRLAAEYEIFIVSGNKCNIELNLYYPFNRTRIFLRDVLICDVDHAVLDYMSLQSVVDSRGMRAFAFKVLE